jgi:hypothetical protein
MDQSQQRMAACATACDEVCTCNRRAQTRGHPRIHKIDASQLFMPNTAATLRRVVGSKTCGEGFPPPGGGSRDRVVAVRQEV